MNERASTPGPDAAPRAARNPLGDRAPPAAETLVTVLMCDLVDSTRLSTALRARQLADILLAYYAVCLGAARTRGGRVIRYIGDGVVCVFEHTQRSGDGARNALATALSLRHQVHDIALPAADDAPRLLRARIALATGWGLRSTFPQDNGSCQELIFGEIPFVADRMKGFAAPDGIVVCSATARLLHSRCTLHCLGERQLRGFPHKRPVWRLLEAASSAQH